MRAGRWSVLIWVIALVATVGVFGGRRVAAEPQRWSRILGGRLSDVAVSGGRSVYVTGLFWAPPVGSDSEHRWAMVVAKYGVGGRLAWHRTWRNREPGWSAEGIGVSPAPGGGVYVGGESALGEFAHPMLWRYSAAGRLLWRQRLPVSFESGEILSLASDARGVVAAVQDHGVFDNVAHDGAIQALDPSGRPTWRTDFEVPGITGTWDAIGGVAIGPHGSVYAVGHVDRRFFDSPEDPWPDQDVVVQKLSRGGDLQWTRVLGHGTDWHRDEASDVAVRARRVVATGADPRGGVGWVGAFSPGGERRWTRTWKQERKRPVALAIAPWRAVYVGAERTMYRPMVTTAALRRYSINGALVSRRDLGKGRLRGIAASHGLYLAIGPRLLRVAR